MSRVSTFLPVFVVSAISPKPVLTCDWENYEIGQQLEQYFMDTLSLPLNIYLGIFRRSTNRSGLLQFFFQALYQSYKDCAKKSCHGAEIPFLFKFNNLTYTNDEIDLSQQMIYYWTNFAKSGNPNLSEQVRENKKCLL